MEDRRKKGASYLTEQDYVFYNHCRFESGDKTDTPNRRWRVKATDSTTVWCCLLIKQTKSKAEAVVQLHISWISAAVREFNVIMFTRGISSGGGCGGANILEGPEIFQPPSVSPKHWKLWRVDMFSHTCRTCAPHSYYLLLPWKHETHTWLRRQRCVSEGVTANASLPCTYVCTHMQTWPGAGGDGGGEEECELPSPPAH